MLWGGEGQESRGSWNEVGKQISGTKGALGLGRVGTIWLDVLECLGQGRPTYFLSRR